MYDHAPGNHDMWKMISLIACLDYDTTVVTVSSTSVSHVTFHIAKYFTTVTDKTDFQNIHRVTQSLQL